MSKINSEHWMVIITAATLFVGILGLSFLHVYDYSVAVDSMSVSVNPNDTVYTAVEINNGLFFDEDISLRTESVSPHIHVNFEPDIIKKGDSLNSKVNVSIDKEATPGEYVIPIISSSSDGKEHKCTFKLKVPLDNTPIDTPTETQSEVDTPTETQSEVDTPTETESEVDTPTETESEVDTPTEVSTQTNSHAITTPTPVDVSPYLDWNFTIYKSSLYSTNPDWSAPEGESYVKVAIHLKNEGDIPISTMPDCWKFVSDGTTYSYDALLTPTDGIMKYEVKPGESYTFEMDYVVKGEPTSGSLVYKNPYVKI